VTLLQTPQRIRIHRVISMTQQAMHATQVERKNIPAAQRTSELL
jgi:hypothetical protein